MTLSVEPSVFHTFRMIQSRRYNSLDVIFELYIWFYFVPHNASRSVAVFSYPPWRISFKFAEQATMSSYA